MWRQAKDAASRSALVGLLAPGLLQEMAARWAHGTGGTSRRVAPRGVAALPSLPAPPCACGLPPPHHHHHLGCTSGTPRPPGPRTRPPSLLLPSSPLPTTPPRRLHYRVPADHLLPGCPAHADVVAAVVNTGQAEKLAAHSLQAIVRRSSM